MKKFSITRNGEPLDESLYTWDEKTKTLSTEENKLILDFSSYSNCTFNTGFGCTFKAGSFCTFKVGSYCTFDTDYNCIFNTGSDCTFNTNFGCTFNTGSNCTFNTGSGCTFDAGDSCTFNTGSGCTFDVGYDCTFRTGSLCSFNTGSRCTFDTDFYCTFKAGSDCTFDTSNNCTFNTSNGCTFDTGYSCTFDTSYSCTFDTGYSCMLKTGDSCVFNTSYACTFNTGFDCTFNTGCSCTFEAGDNCTFNTGFGCTFNTKNKCVIVRRDTFEFYDISNTNELTLAPCCIKGYVKDGYYYKDGKKQYKAIIADDILSQVISHKGNVYKVKNYGETEITYLVQDGDVYSHGKTLKEAKESLIYKLSNRDTSRYKDYTLGTKVSKKEAIQMYRVITGACEQGTRMFVEHLDKVPRNLTVKKIIELTKEQYGNSTFRKFFGEVSE